MMGKREIPLDSGDEHDALSPGRKMYHWKPGTIKLIKRRFNKRVRREMKANRQFEDEQ